jgi:hypothetical protein
LQRIRNFIAEVDVFVENRQLQQMGYQTPNQMISYREESSSDEEEAFQTRDKSNTGSYEPINMEKSSTEAVDKNDRTSLPVVRQ